MNPERNYLKITVILALFIAVIDAATSAYFYRLKITKPIIEITSSLPLSTDLGKQVFDGATLALDERRADFPEEAIMFTVRDDTSLNSWGEPQLRRNLQSFIDNPNTLAFFGPLHSTAAKVAIPILNKAGIPMISPTNSLPSLTKEGFAIGEPSIFYPAGRRNYVRFSQTDDVELAEAALWAKTLNIKKVLLVDDHTIDYSSALALMRGFRESSKLDTERVTEEPAESVNDLAQQIAGAKPDLIYFLGISPQNFNTFASALNQIKYSGRLMSGLSTASVIDIPPIKNQLEGMLVIGSNVSITASSTQGHNFAKNYKARYGEDPVLLLAGTSYESMNLLLDAIAQSDRTRNSVLTQLFKIHNRATMFGPISFDKQGDSSLHYTSRLMLHDGELAPFIAPSTTPTTKASAQAELLK